MTQATTLMTSITLNGRTESNVVTDAKGSHAKGSHAKGSHAKGSHAKGSHAKGSHAKGSHATSVSSKGFAVSQLA